MEGEDALRQALAEAKANGVTVFVITQRESLLPLADKIMRIQNGGVTDFGSRDEVLAKHRRPIPAATERPRKEMEGVQASSRFATPIRASIDRKG